MIRVCHVISGLRTGGAEAVLGRLIAATQGRTLCASVVSLSEPTRIAGELERLGVPITSLSLGRRPAGLARVRGLAPALRAARPDVVQGWMYHGNLAATAGVRWARLGSPVVWNVRGSQYGVERERPLTRLVVLAGRSLSRGPSRIVYDSETSRTQHRTLGYSDRRALTIPNGFDTGRFAPDAAARRDARAELGVSDDTLLVGHLARYHPAKDHVTLLRAFEDVRKRVPAARLVLAGRGVDQSNPELQTLIGHLGLGGGVMLLGERTDVPRLLAALDLLCSSSAWGEGFPNVLGETMACGVPCVATDIGDSREVLGDTGRVVPPRNAAALAEACVEVLTLGVAERRRLGEAARARVVEHFAIEAIAERYVALYHEVTGRTGPAAPSGKPD
ncbi:MAG: glycosyltransferase [Gemmatimonadales bacterium]